MSKMKWRTAAAAVGLGWLAAASWLPAQEGPKADSLPAGPTLVFDAETKECHATTEEDGRAVHVSCHQCLDKYHRDPGCLCFVSLHGGHDAGPAVDSGARGERRGHGHGGTGRQEEEELTKTLTFFTSVGERVLTLNVLVDAAAAPAARR